MIWIDINNSVVIEKVLLKTSSQLESMNHFEDDCASIITNIFQIIAENINERKSPQPLTCCIQIRLVGIGENVFCIQKQPPEMFQYFVKFTGKHLCQSLFFKETRCFPVNFVKFLRIPFLHDTSEWLLLYIIRKQV